MSHLLPRSSSGFHETRSIRGPVQSCRLLAGPPLLATSNISDAQPENMQAEHGSCSLHVRLTTSTPANSVDPAPVP